ncbi:hypothetical protein BOTBODRAFT_192191 [Botryobasidium botryosum FD-172 SS1]|uniref:F-box domain-containing protein n=1 Tax=Botryobasidium botryosum (strain FD-172 SS1) TaxID=930990 RepID=A0A067M8F1_BOTB1|nr:hypothetical protein BOTBODRAFT_192191 [Botryobasidium botryosum FD-172 SS1]
MSRIDRFDPPVYRICDDVLLYIISIYATAPTDDPNPNRFVYDRDSLTCISHVCSLWRRLAHGYPNFWSLVTVSISSREPETQIAHQLALARACPIEVRVYGQTDDILDDEEKIIRAIANALKGSMSRWRVLSLSLPDTSGLLSAFFSIFSGDAPLSLECLDIMQFCPVRSLYIPLGPAKSGIHVSLMCSIPSFSPAFGLAIAHLTINFGPGFSIDDIFICLQSCANLEYLALRTIAHEYYREPLTLPYRPIPLPRLRHISVAGSHDIERLLNRLVFSSLSHLELRKFIWSHGLLAYFDSIIHHFPKLLTLTLKGRYFRYIGNNRHAVPHFHPGDAVVLPLAKEFIVSGGYDFASNLIQRMILPNVQCLKLGDTIKRGKSQTGAPPTPLSLPTLMELEIRGPGGFHFLDHLDLPSLDSLRLQGPTDEHDLASIGIHVYGLLQRSTPPLRVLRPVDVLISDDDLARYLRLVPQVEKLELNGCLAISDAFFHLLAEPSSVNGETDWLLLRLNIFELSIPSDAENAKITPRGVVEFLKSRNGPSSTRTGAVPRIAGSLAFPYALEADVNDARSTIEASSLIKPNNNIWANHTFSQSLDVAIIWPIPPSYELSILGQLYGS